MKEIKLGRTGLFTQVDDDDFERVNKIKWHLWKCCNNDSIYVRGNVIGSDNKAHSITIHSYIIGEIDKGLEIDHRDRNIFNNTRANLRVCTKSQNACNKPSYKNASSKYKGVSFLFIRNKYIANICHNYKTHYLGIFKSEIEAALAYDKVAKKLHGEFAVLNFPNGAENIPMIDGKYVNYLTICEKSIKNARNYLKNRR